MNWINALLAFLSIPLTVLISNLVIEFVKARLQLWTEKKKQQKLLVDSGVHNLAELKKTEVQAMVDLKRNEDEVEVQVFQHVFKRGMSLEELVDKLHLRIEEQYKARIELLEEQIDREQKEKDSAIEEARKLREALNSALLHVELGKYEALKKIDEIEETKESK